MANINRDTSTKAPPPAPPKAKAVDREITITVTISTDCQPETLKALGEMMKYIVEKSGKIIEQR